MSKERQVVDDFLNAKHDSFCLMGEAIATVYRFDGSVEVYKKTNQISYNGLNNLANRAIGDATSPFGFIAVGTLTAAASLDSEITSFGEVDRKAATTAASSREIFFCTATWGGAADSVTSLSLSAAAIVNHVNSGQGVPMNIVNNLGPVVLADSDFMNLEMRMRVGSHNV